MKILLLPPDGTLLLLHTINCNSFTLNSTKRISNKCKTISQHVFNGKRSLINCIITLKPCTPFSHHVNSHTKHSTQTPYARNYFLFSVMAVGKWETKIAECINLPASAVLHFVHISNLFRFNFPLCARFARVV